jgi:hypothetical protein
MLWITTQNQMSFWGMQWEIPFYVMRGNPNCHFLFYCPCIKELLHDIKGAYFDKINELFAELRENPG